LDKTLEKFLLLNNLAVSILRFFRDKARLLSDSVRSCLVSTLERVVKLFFANGEEKVGQLSPLGRLIFFWKELFMWLDLMFSESCLGLKVAEEEAVVHDSFPSDLLE